MDERSRGASILEEARRAAGNEDWSLAARSARTVVEEYASLSGSTEALRILARASLETGDLQTAQTASEQVIEIFGAGDPRSEEARLVLGEALLVQGDTVSAVIRLSEMPPGANSEVMDPALEIVRSVTPSLSLPDLQAILDRVPSPGPVLAPVQVEYGVALYFQGADEESRRMGREAQASGARGQDAQIAEALAEGRVESALGRAPELAALLPASGPPTLVQYGELLEEGIRIALEEFRGADRRPVQLRVLDDGGRVQNLPDLLPQAEESRAGALIGPLLDDAVAAAASLRRRNLLILSPTARTLPGDQRAVYSLSGPDPGPARSIARYAARSGIGTVVVAYPRDPASTYEATAFREAFNGEGGQVLRELSYPVGTTYFEETLREVEALVPDALVLPLRPEDIELMAPQVTFFGLDTLGIQVLGTGGWTTESVLQNVDPRHTNGVVATTDLPSGLPSPEAGRFRERYEAVYRKTLRSDVPALGYDAARILLSGYQAGASSAGDLARFLEGLEDFPGATGTLSVRDGLLVREHTLVRLENRTLFPVFTP